MQFKIYDSLKRDIAQQRENVEVEEDLAIPTFKIKDK